MPLQVAVKQQNGSVSEHFLFEGRDYRIGRSADSDIVVSHPQVSRAHAQIHVNKQNQWCFSDTSSTGCFTNNKQVKHLVLDRPVELKLGPISCELEPIDHSNVIRLDSQKVWRQGQLRQYENKLNTCASSSDLVALARECLMQSLGCERASLILFDDVNDFHLGVGYEPWMNGKSFTGSRTIINHSVRNKELMAVGCTAADAMMSHQQSVVKNKIQAAISVPVFIKDKVVGVLYADSVQSRRYFTNTDIEFASSLANLISLRLLFHTIEYKLTRLV